MSPLTLPLPHGVRGTKVSLWTGRTESVDGQPLSCAPGNNTFSSCAKQNKRTDMWEAEAGGRGVQVRPGLHRETLLQNTEANQKPKQKRDILRSAPRQQKGTP